MQDGNTAIQVSPVSEDEMSQIQGLFKKAADTLVAFSSLSEQVKTMQAELNDLRNQVNRYRNQIDTQDEALFRLRQGREELMRSESEAKSQAADAKAQVDSLARDVDHWQGVANDTQARLDTMRRDRDEAQYQVEELKEKVKGLEDTLAKFRDLARALEPVPTPADLGEHSGQSESRPIPFPSFPQTTPEPEPSSDQVVKTGW